MHHKSFEIKLLVYETIQNYFWSYLKLFKTIKNYRNVYSWQFLANYPCLFRSISDPAGSHLCACQQNVVLFELVGEILFDVEALSITYSSLVEPWHVAMSCWRYSSQGPALPEGISSVAWTSDLIDGRNGVSMGSMVTGLCGARPSDCWFNGKGRALDAERANPKTESTWIREAVHITFLFAFFRINHRSICFAILLLGGQQILASKARSNLIIWL